MSIWRSAGTIALTCLIFCAATRHALAADSELRLARSEDGLEFSPVGNPLIQNASAPDLETLPNGDLILVFDLPKGGAKQPTMHMSISHDQGKTWSKAQPIVINDPRGRPVDGRHPELVRTADGSIRIYFTISGPERSRDRKLTLIRTAGTSSGTRFQIDGSIPESEASTGESHATAIRMGSRIHIFVDQPFDASEENDSGAGHFVSLDGTRFSRKTSPRLPRPGLVGSIIRAKEGMRAYVTSKDGIRSLLSSNAVIWKDDPGLRIKSASDPAVTRLPDGNYLMAYCSTAASSRGMFAIEIDDAHPALADATKSRTDAPLQEENATANNTANLDASTDESTEPGLDTPRTAEAHDQLPTRSPLFEFIEDPWLDDFGFAPRPNFQQHVDYLQWWRDQMVNHPADNAYSHYSAFLGGVPGVDPEVPGLPRLTNMFTDRSYDQPPGPWNPTDHPEWEESNATAQSLIEQYRQAASHDGYSQEIDDAYMARLTDDNGHTSLAALMIPSLRGHRDLTKATLADAWRTEDGQVSAEKMMDAWKTTFRSSGHLNQGATLIEELVSIAQRDLIHDTARWALQRDVFNDDQLEEALDILSQYDPGNRDSAKFVQGEYAFAMDSVQTAFWPTEPEGKAAFRPDRDDWFFPATEQQLQSVREFNESDIAETIESLDRYYHDLGEAVNVGYPEVRSSDIRALKDMHFAGKPFPQSVLPDLSRVHMQRTRIEASRRATQLSYAVRIYKNRHGDWPESLEAVSSEFGYEMTTDPFTGDYFSYQLTDDGPKIYSLGDNGIDDGGHYQPRWGDRANQAQGDDGVFWPPQQ